MFLENRNLQNIGRIPVAIGISIAVNGESEKYKGYIAGKRNLIPGRHEVVVKAKVNGNDLQEGKVILGSNRRTLQGEANLDLRLKSMSLV